MKPYYDHLPELASVEMYGIEDHLGLSKDLGPDKIRKLAAYVIRKMASYFGGYHHFWADAASQELVMPAWFATIGSIKTRTVLSGLYAVITNPEFTPKGIPPRSAIEFRSICNKAKSIFDNIKIETTGFLEDHVPKKTEDELMRNREKIRHMTKNPTNTDGVDYLAMYHENRSMPTALCPKEKHARYFIDQGCPDCRKEAYA